MRQLALNIAKDVKITDLVCSPNRLVMGKQFTSTNDKTGEVIIITRFIEVCPIEKTDKQTILQTLLRYIITEFFVRNDLQNTFAETNITQRKLFNQFLSIYTI